MVEYSDMSQIAAIITPITSCIFFIVSGIMADYYGRKPTLLLGFVFLGFTYSMVPYMSNPLIDLLSAFLTGVAWSCLLSSLFFTIMGDLGRENFSELYYAISGTSYMIIEMGLALFASSFSINFSVSLLSSILSISMFSSVFPLLYAPETLPENKILDRRMSNYLERVFKVLETEENK
jgi:MFS family permease